MKTIPLTQDKVALVDDEDFDRINRFKWSISGKGNYRYAHSYRSPGKWVLMHREIMGAPDGIKVDHWDHDGFNNQKRNLRLCSHLQNLMNHKKSTRNTSGFMGVFFNKEKRKWDAQMKVKGRSTHLGRFDTAIEAAQKYNEVAIEKFGEFASLNAL